MSLDATSIAKMQSAFGETACQTSASPFELGPNPRPPVGSVATVERTPVTVSSFSKTRELLPRLFSLDITYSVADKAAVHNVTILPTTNSARILIRIIVRSRKKAACKAVPQLYNPISSLAQPYLKLRLPHPPRGSKVGNHKIR